MVFGTNHLMIKKFVFSILFLCCSVFLFGQELSEKHKGIPMEKNEEATESFFLAPISFFGTSSATGPFQIDRYRMDLNIMDIGLPRDTPEKPIDILAIARARESERRTQSRIFEATSRQLAQIQKQSRVFVNNRDSYIRSNNQLEFNSRLTPDGGIRNEAIQDIRQPFIDPFYGTYGYPYYYPNSSRNYRNRSRGGFYFY